MSASFSRYLIFPSCLVTANAYGSNTQLHVTQNADMFANINHVDIQRTFDIREYRYDACIFPGSLAIRCTCVECKKRAKIKSIFSRKGDRTAYILYFSMFKMHRLHLQCQEVVLSRSEIIEAYEKNARYFLRNLITFSSSDKGGRKDFEI